MIRYLLGLSFILPFSYTHMVLPDYQRFYHAPIPAPTTYPTCTCPDHFTPLPNYQQFNPSIYPQMNDHPAYGMGWCNMRGGARENVKEIDDKKSAIDNKDKKPVIDMELDPGKAEECAKKVCDTGSYSGPVCACNHLTGKVATFGSSCDLKRHNCRYETDFHMTLEEVCPWEYQSRRSNKNQPKIDYSDPKYYN